MSREIQFRVWDIQSRRFMSGNERFPGKFMIDTNGILHTKSNEKVDECGGGSSD